MYLIVINVYNHYVWIMSDGEVTKIKVVDLDEFYQLAVDDFFIWNHLLCQNYIRSSHILKSKFRIIQTKSYGEMTKIKVVYLDDLYNFVVYNFSI